MGPCFSFGRLSAPGMTTGAAQPQQVPAAGEPAAARPASSGSTARTRRSSRRVLEAETFDVGAVYVLGRVLGEGSHGSVCLARHRQTGASTAMKTMNKAGHSTLKSLRREVSAMKAMDHENIIKLLDTFEDAGRVHLAMELASGGELYHRIIDQHRFPEARAAVVMRQVLSAVEFVHRADIAHRDLKPENLVFTSAGAIEAKGNTLKLIDFGLACPCAEGDVLRGAVGTPIYMAPQVPAGSYDRRCDIWSAGVILYVMLSGEVPIETRHDTEAMARVIDGRWGFGSPAWAHVSCGAKRLVGSLMTRSVEARASAADALRLPWLRCAEEASQAHAAPAHDGAACAASAPRLDRSTSTATPSSAPSTPRSHAPQ